MVRKACGLTKADVARLTKKPWQTINRIEKGRNKRVDIEWMEATFELMKANAKNL